jgi:RNA polymerase sigma-70 factor (ECF subfamily)
MPTVPDCDNQRFTRLLLAARGGKTAAIGQLLEMHWESLLHVAKQNLSPQMRAKLDEFDIVQDTLVEVAANFDQFSGSQSHEFAGWLKAALLNNVRDARRRFESQRRAVGREVSLHDSAIRDQLKCNSPSPSSRIRRQEGQQLIEQATEHLSAEHREVLDLRHRKNLNFWEIARHLGRSENSVRKLWARAMAKLRARLTGH